jgi:hypothetical protein
MIPKITVTTSSNGTNTILKATNNVNLTKMQRYDICVTEPIPCSGLDLPILIEFESNDDKSSDQKVEIEAFKNEASNNKTNKTYPLVRFGLGDHVFGCNEKGIHCIRTYFNSQGEFVDVRIKECVPYCECDND